MFTTDYELLYQNEPIHGEIVVEVLEPAFLHAVVDIEDIKLNVSITSYISKVPFGPSYEIFGDNFFYFVTLLDFDYGYRWDPIMEMDETHHHSALERTGLSERKRTALIAAVNELIQLAELPRIDLDTETVNEAKYIEVRPQYTPLSEAG